MIDVLVKNIYTIIASFSLDSYRLARNVITSIIAMVALPFSSYCNANKRNCNISLQFSLILRLLALPLQPPKCRLNKSFQSRYTYYIIESNFYNRIAADENTDRANCIMQRDSFRKSDLQTLTNRQRI